MDNGNTEEFKTFLIIHRLVNYKSKASQKGPLHGTTLESTNQSINGSIVFLKKIKYHTQKVKRHNQASTL